MAARELKFKLNNGKEMPLIGLGTYKVYGQSLIFSVIEAALKAGYRAIDTAAVYGNEEDIGLALKELLPKYNLTRQDIFLTSKLAPCDHGREKVSKAVYRSLANLGTTYLDLYLIHWPGVQGFPVNSPANAKLRAESWSELVTLYKKGVLSAIGVSNYTTNHVKELLVNCCGVKPAVNQVEYHPHYRQSKLQSFCQENNIIVQAYCSLGGSSDHRLLQESVVLHVANKLGHSPAEILLRWALQQGVGIIPKSVHSDRIAANINLDFSIPDTEMQMLNNVPTVKKYAWDPEVVV